MSVRSTRRHLGAILCLVPALLCARPAAAQQQARLAERLDPATARAVTILLDSARAVSLPAEPLLQKAFEGASKGADPDAIVAAVRGLLRDLDRARTALAGETPAVTLELAAAALQAGAAPGTIERLRAYRTRRAFDGALTGLVYLMSRGVSNDAASNIIAGMLDAGLSPSEFVSLQRLVEQDVRSGVPPVDAARLRSRALIQRGPGSAPGGNHQ
jgi:hypothetical protein